MEAKRSEHEGAEKSGGGWFRIVWIGCVLVLSYVLSIGPVTKFSVTHRKMRSFLSVYAPLDPFRKHFYPVERFSIGTLTMFGGFRVP